MRRVEDFRRLARTCPHCGAREPTLGTECPSCGRPYDPGTWVDRGPFPVDMTARGGAYVGAVVGLIDLAFAALWALLRLPWLLARRLLRR